MPSKNSFGQILSRPLSIALILFAAASLVVFMIIDTMVMPYFAGRFKNQIDVPSLLRQTPDEATLSLNKLGLRLKLDTNGEFSDSIPKGKIVLQSPESGSRVKGGRRVWVQVSLGAQLTEAPALRGLSLRQAEITLQQLGLQIGHLREIRQGNVPAGAVIGSRPAPGTQLQRGASIDIDVSLGTSGESVQMPTLLGLSLEQAKKQMQALSLELGKITTRSEPKSLPKTVLTQNPSAGSPLPRGPVDLTISK